MGSQDQVSGMLPVARLIVSSALQALTASVDGRSRENARAASVALREGFSAQV